MKLYRPSSVIREQLRAFRQAVDFDSLPEIKDDDFAAKLQIDSLKTHERELEEELEESLRLGI